MEGDATVVVDRLGSVFAARDGPMPPKLGRDYFLVFPRRPAGSTAGVRLRRGQPVHCSSQRVTDHVPHLHLPQISSCAINSPMTASSASCRSGYEISIRSSLLKQEA
ncbi:hypothetical protein SAY87_022724 [Trapa incisa]|uniref:Uncharacterized protein n=1 Tax=Trapa incisa TaxID=236973 RepID=A0AAN7K896_9MYRT|nr:hypothetical protein SAY87_022724 [Trapa incisa]